MSYTYVVDVQLYLDCSIEGARDTIDVINDIRLFSDWCSEHGLRINPAKTMALCIGNKETNTYVTSNLNLNIDNVILQWTTSARSLGVDLDNDLSFSNQCNKVYQMSMFKLKSIYSLKKQLDEFSKLHLAKSLIYPHIDYCSQVYYAFLPKYNKLKIQRIQNAGMRFVCNLSYRDHISPHLKRLKEPEMRERLEYLYVMLLYKIFKNKIPIYLIKLIINRSQIHSVNIRVNSFTVPQHTTSKYKNCFSYMAPTLLNKFIDDLSLPLVQFKSNVRSKIGMSPYFN